MTNDFASKIASASAEPQRGVHQRKRHCACSGSCRQGGGIHQPAVTQKQLAALSKDDTVFLKAFGYGRIISLNGSCIEVTFDGDKKKPSRKFMFPSAFFQGLLQIG